MPAGWSGRRGTEMPRNWILFAAVNFIKLPGNLGIARKKQLGDLSRSELWTPKVGFLQGSQRVLTKF